MDPNLRHKPRLLSEEELPSWLLKDEDEVRNYVQNFQGFIHNKNKINAKTKVTKLHTIVSIE